MARSRITPMVISHISNPDDKAVKNQPQQDGRTKGKHQNTAEIEMMRQKLSGSSGSSGSSQPNDYDKSSPPADEYDRIQVLEPGNNKNGANQKLNRRQLQQIQIKNKEEYARTSNELLRSSLESSFNPHDNHEMANKDFAGFEFEQEAVIGASQPIHIDLNEGHHVRKAKIQEKEDLMGKFYQQPEEEHYYVEDDDGEYDFEDVELEDNHQKEGGDAEKSNQADNVVQFGEEFKDDGDGSSPTPFQSSPKIPKQNIKKPRAAIEGGRTRNAEGPKDTPSEDKPIVLNSSYQDESTPSLHTVYKNYRELKVQQTSSLKRVIGVAILSLALAGLLLIHVLLMAEITKTQFINWISCGVFSFSTTVFIADSAIYATVAWALKRSASSGAIDRRHCCSFFSMFVIWPLGRWKFMELEVELAKLKDFDKEYVAAQLAAK